MIKLVFLLIEFCIFSGIVKSEEAQKPNNNQNLYQHIKTEVIDLPDDTGVQSGSFDPYKLHNRDVVYPWLDNNKVQVYGNDQKYASVYPDQYYVNTYPSYQQSYYSNYPYPYRPFYAGDYVYRNYPSLYRHFPNGFFVFPDVQNIATSKATTTTSTTTNSDENRGNIADVSNAHNNVNTATDNPQTLRINNYTHIGEKKTFVNHVELKPVSTKFTRFGGPDGKMYVKVVSSDNEGQDKITESEYTGNIDLKITNGVLETPINNSSTPMKNTYEESTEPNSIGAEVDLRINEVNDLEEEKEEEEKEEDNRPLDITSWLG